MAGNVSENEDLSEIQYGGAGYGSEFDEQETFERRKTWRDDELSGIKRKSNTTSGLPNKRMVSNEYSRVEAKGQKYEFIALDAYSKHKKMINDYILYYGKGIEHYKRDSSRDKTDLDVIKEEHRFIWNEEDNPESTWEKRLAKKYYDKLFKEYCISDLSRYKENKVALRWRIEKEVIDGKGQFICGDKRCTETEGLRSWEVNFGYMEHGEKKNTLIKLRLCPDCSYKLNYRHQRKLAKQRKKEKITTSVESLSTKEKNKKHKDKDRPVPSVVSGNHSDDERDVPSGSAPNKEASSVEDIWKGPAKKTVDKTREEEFEEYFQDMFL
ncbi:unnamed protein product [Porites lobata]|uniref:Protein FRA10AC1 n=1 Tax=Porites lobata TaxID=104759 RepID=A0ABN8MT78_9CNID|nr:unnamed protein product [Porites lobata]